MAWGQEKGADFHISALRACQYEIFDFVPCSLPLKTLILLTFLCFLIRRRGKAAPFAVYFRPVKKAFFDKLNRTPADTGVRFFIPRRTGKGTGGCAPSGDG